MADSGAFGLTKIDSAAAQKFDAVRRLSAFHLALPRSRTSTVGN